MSAMADREVIFVHSSDLHLGAGSWDGSNGSDPALALRGVLDAASASRADFVLLAGDTFDHNRQSSELLDWTAGVMAEFRAPIVILPGNHDPLTPDSVYRRPEMSTVRNLCVLGLTVEEAVMFPGLGLEVWGKAHVDYLDMSPLDRTRSRSTRWQLAAAHGHYVDEPPEDGRFVGSWIIRREEISATGADYVALGHWNRAARVGDPRIHAYYSGSPDYVGTVNIVRLQPHGSVEVTRVSLNGAKI